MILAKLLVFLCLNTAKGKKVHCARRHITHQQHNHTDPPSAVKMRSTTAILCFYLASWASCTPIPLVLVDNLEAVPPAAYPPAPVALTRPEQAIPKVLIMDPLEAPSEEPIDNHPITPSRTASPTAVLASPQPVVTSYLLSLARLGFGRRFQAFYAAQFQSDEDEYASSSSSMDVADSGAPWASMASYYPTVTRERGDVLAISLVAIFLFFVVVVEAWSAVSDR